MPFQPVKAESLSAQVFETIRDAIFRGELKPGETLRELGLAKSLNVSQATVREALAHLEQFGLVVRTPNRSTTVTAFSEEEARQRQKIRLALECLAFLEAREKVSKEQLEELSTLAESASAAKQSADTFSVINTERQFHARVWEISGNSVLARMLGQLTMPLFVRRAMQNGHGELTSDYSGLVEQLRSGDQSTMVDALKRHVVDPAVEDVAVHEDTQPLATQTPGA